ncbi:MAG TPA: serine/threonine-protein kinase, partial [Polyangiaceae bacterium]
MPLARSPRASETEDRNADAYEAETKLKKDAAPMSQVDSWDGATLLADPEDELIGKTLNDTYVVERVLGEGGMGRVYLARHNRIAQKRVAVKVLHPEYLRNTEMLARFQREAETAASICHPNVVVVYDVDRTSRGLPYLVCEYLEGCDLGHYLKEQKVLSQTMAVHVVRQLCEGLRAAHQSGVIHRDLKPHNIFLVGDFSDGVPELPFIKILDFGLSKFIDVTDGQLVTRTGVVMGTPAFMAPEQALGQRADTRADIYGAGALLYTCLTGQVPFEESTPQATVLAVINGEPTRPRVLAPSISEYAELVIQRAMARQPEERYPDMTAMLKALEPLVLDLATSESGATRPMRVGSLDTQAERAKSARPKLALLLLVAFGFLLGSTAVALVGIEQIAGWSLTRRELGLMLGCGAAVAFTPTLLVMRRVRNAVWTNTNRVLGLFYAVRVALLTVVVTYGLAWFVSRIFDGV